jgi:rRNA maturation endonuclease Nob1
MAQNVLLQMGLGLVSLQGRRVRSVKTFVFKCSSCLRITHLVTREFCPSCGNHTLFKVCADLVGHVWDMGALLTAACRSR